MTDVAKAVAGFERNIEAQTGKSVAAWVGLALEQRLARHNEIIAYLKLQYGLSHSHANHIARSALKPEAAPDDPVSYLFDGGKEDLRPLYDCLVSYATGLGTDVEIAPKKLNVSLRRRRQFALLQPTTRTRLDLGLILPGRGAPRRDELGAVVRAEDDVGVADVRGEQRGHLIVGFRRSGAHAPLPHLGPESLGDIRRHVLVDRGAERRELFHARCGNEEVFGGGHEVDHLDPRREAPVHVRHLELELEIGERANSADDKGGPGC